MKDVKLGSTARDTITGFEGVVTAITTWLNGCVRVSIQPRELREGKPLDAVTFDVEQVEVVEAQAVPELRRTGGPMPDPVRR